MKAIKELGFKRLMRYVLHSLFLKLLDFSLFPPLRSVLLRLAGVEIGENTVINNIKLFNSYHRGFQVLKIGKDCYLGEEAMFDLANEIIIEEQVTITQRVLVLTHTKVGYKDHPLQKYFPRIDRGVVFKKGCFIGAGSIILPGVTVGENSFVAAGSVVTKDVASMTLVGGVPAKEIRKLT